MATFTSVHDAHDHTGVPGVGGSIDATDGTTTVSPASTLDFDPTYFDVTDGGGGVAEVTFVGSSGVASGTSFPVSPSDGDLFYRTDLDCGLFRYYSSGTKWLCTTQHRLAFMTRTAIGSTGLSATLTSAANASTNLVAGDMWIDDFIGTILVQTTSSGTQYWDIALVKLDAANSSTTVATVSSISNTASNWVNEVTAVDAFVSNGTYLAFRIDITKVSTPGNCFPTWDVLWRHGYDV